jgi:hypothetical protein
LDAAVDFADNNPKDGEKNEGTFDATHGSGAQSQTDYKKIQEGANKLVAAGNALDKGLDKFGGHRVKAIKAIHRALDELDLAVKEAVAK